MLWCIRHGKAALRALLLRMSSKPIARKLTATIRTESFDARVMPYLRRGRKGFVRLDSLVFGSKYFKPSISSMVVRKSNIIPTSSQGQRRGPNVLTGFFSKYLGLWVVLAYSQESQ